MDTSRNNIIRNQLGFIEGKLHQRFLNERNCKPSQGASSLSLRVLLRGLPDNREEFGAGNSCPESQ
jgi:hypothetical protein